MAVESILLDSYELVNGLVGVAIYREPETGLYIYFVKEPTLSDGARRVLEGAKERLRLSSPLNVSMGNNIDEKIDELMNEVSRRLRVHLSNYETEAVRYYLRRDIVGYGKIDPLLHDDNIEDVNINGPNRPIYVWHSRYEHLKTNIALDSSELESLVVKLSQRVGKNVNSANPILEGLLPEGIRVELLLRDVAYGGPIVNIRKFKENPITIVDLINEGVMSPEELALLWLMLENRISILVIGPTGAGKTTLLNSILYLIRPESRIVTIEDTRELNLLHEQWVPLVVRESSEREVRNVTAYELVKVSMRLRPDYLVVGELRGEEAYVFFQAVASGHTGLATLHATSLEAAVRRLIAKPMNVPRALIPLINVVVHIDRVRQGDVSVRRVVDIGEILDYTAKRGLVVNRLFSWNRESGAVVKVNESALLQRIIEEGKLTKDEAFKELERKSGLLKAMAKYGFRSPEAVFKVTRNYYIDPEKTFKSVLGGELP